MHNWGSEQIQAMRDELTSIGFTELTTPEAVDTISKEGTALLVYNSVCGCAAGSARPGIALSLTNEKKPEQLVTVFAGQDSAATEKAREVFADFEPSSPSALLIKDGKGVFFLKREDIMGFSPEEVAQKLQDAYNTHC